MEPFLFNSVILLYSLSALLYFGYLGTKREIFGVVARGLLSAGFLAHLAALGLRCAQGHAASPAYVPWTSLYESLSGFSFFIVAIFLTIAWTTPIPVLGAFVIPLSTALILAAAAQDRSIQAVIAPAIHNPWLSAHIALAFAAYSFLAVAFALGIAFLLQERQLKSKRPNVLSFRLPPLERVDTLIARLIALAFPLLTFALIAGGLWARSAWGRYWEWDPKQTWALVTWLIYFVYLALRWGGGWHGRKSAYLSLSGFGLVLFTYLAINYVSPRHAFLSRNLTEVR
jgi:cytochrome c-type biogenesis protein CcsB